MSIEISTRDLLQVNAILLTGIMILMTLSPGDVSGSTAQGSIYMMKQILGYSVLFFIVSMIISLWPWDKHRLLLSKIMFIVGLGSVFIALAQSRQF